MIRASILRILTGEQVVINRVVIFEDQVPGGGWQSATDLCPVVIRYRRNRVGDFRYAAVVHDDLLHAETVRQLIGQNHTFQRARRDRSARIGGISLASFKARTKTRVALALSLTQRRGTVVTGVYGLVFEFLPPLIRIRGCLLIDILKHRFGHSAVSGAELSDSEFFCWT